MPQSYVGPATVTLTHRTHYVTLGLLGVCPLQETCSVAFLLSLLSALFSL